nr:hypothetical protein [uncultured Flavobacterium sp.]
MRIKFSFILSLCILLVTSCSKEKVDYFNQFTENIGVIEFEKTIDSDENYSFDKPSDWYFTLFEQKNNINFEHVYSKDNNNRFTVFKIKSDEDLNQLSETLIENTRTQLLPIIEGLEILGNGETNFLRYPSYYYHTQDAQGSNVVSFIMKSKQYDHYYRVIIEADKKNLPTMLHCLTTFEILK